MTDNNNINTKRVVKNTGMLYLRMILIMGVSLYTSRVVLEILGIEDFGIYNVVGGIVVMASFLSSSMSSAIQRFLSFELGKNNLVELGRVFSMSVNIHIIIAILVLILSETFGLWFVNNKLTIPENRIYAANIVYQFSILTFLVNIISVPYNAAILAYEKMNIFAYIGVVEVGLKLLSVFALMWFGYDKLALYAIFLFLIALLIRGLYGLYVNRSIPDCKHAFFWDKKLFKTLINFAGWNLWGNLAVVTYTQGINILLNIFFGPFINAARAIAFQVNSALNSFISNFQIALKPQIIKSYASGDNEYMQTLIFGGAKYSFFLMLLLCAPIILSTPQVLSWWLGTVPDYTIIFCRLVLVESLINSISGTLMAGVQATGKIKLYQGIVGGLLLLILPISYAFLQMGYPPETTLYVSISVGVLALVARLIIVSSILRFSKKLFIKRVIIPIVLISGIMISVGITLTEILDGSISRFLIANTIITFAIIFLIWFVGLNKMERNFVVKKISNSFFYKRG